MFFLKLAVRPLRTFIFLSSRYVHRLSHCVNSRRPELTLSIAGLPLVISLFLRMLFPYHRVCLFTSYHVLNLQKLRNSAYSDRGWLVMTALSSVGQRSCLPCYYGWIWVNASFRNFRGRLRGWFLLVLTWALQSWRQCCSPQLRCALSGSTAILLLHSWVPRPQDLTPPLPPAPRVLTWSCYSWILKRETLVTFLIAKLREEQIKGRRAYSGKGVTSEAALGCRRWRGCSLISGKIRTERAPSWCLSRFTFSFFFFS